VGDFVEVVVADQADPTSKDDFLFVGIINAGAVAFDTTTKDFEMLVATPDTGTVESYYFYVEMT